MARPRGVWSDKEFREAVRKAVHETDEGGVKKLRKIAVSLVDAAAGGAPWAVAEVANRLDGRPAQDVHIDQRVTHDLSRISDAELAAILAEEAGSAGSVKAPDDQGQLH